MAKMEVTLIVWYSTSMKKIIALSLSLILTVCVFADASKSFVLGIGETFHFDSYAEGKEITPAAMITFEQWSTLNSSLGIWINGSFGKASSLIELPKGSSSYTKFDLDKGFMINTSIGLALNMDMGRYTLNIGFGPHVNMHLMEIIRTQNISSGVYGLTAGLGGTIESRLKLGNVLFLTVGCPVSYDMFKMNNSDVTDYRRIAVAPFAGIGFTH